jgi:hypothetical protein
MTVLMLQLMTACSDYGLGNMPGDPPEAPPTPLVPLYPPGPNPVPEIEVTPDFHDFGVADPGVPVSQAITIANVGVGQLVVTGLTYNANSPEMYFSEVTADNGQLPWELAEGESRDVVVMYTPLDEEADQGILTVGSNDPANPVVDAVQVGSGQPFPGFSTGWYIVEDDTPIDLTTDPSHVVDYNGDSDAYWYEPSGVHGMTGSTDVATDFAFLHDYIIGRAGAPTPVTGPLNFYGTSTLNRYRQGSFSYILCDFWLDPTEDPSHYTISAGDVDDGIRVIVNGEILGELTYGQTGSWPLTNAIAGQVNTLVVINEDNAEIEKYIYDLAFYKDGVMVTGS